MHSGSVISTRAMGAVAGLVLEASVSLLVILVRLIERVKRWLELLCLPVSGSSYKRKEGGDSSNLSGVLMHTVG